MKLSYFLIAYACLSQACSITGNYQLSKRNPEISTTRAPQLLSAFFGLDDAMPALSKMIWRDAPGKDGMPLVFSHEISPETLSPSDFLITTSRGEKIQPEFVTFRPAAETFELRTVLLIGEMGDEAENPPVKVEIVDELMTRAGQNLTGLSVPVTPLKEGPFISYAEFFPFDPSYPYVRSGRGCDCPRNETYLVLRTVWSGGVRAKDGQELGVKELQAFRITLVTETDTIEVRPFQLADLDDNDNNIDLCIKEKGIPLAVSCQAGIAIDPRGDANPFTRCEALSRW